MKQILSGMGVSAGKAQGKVCLVLNRNDYSKFKEGDILVTTMTDPTMTLLMCKAAGIITDTGGLTCHAAIVARELGVPCIVAAQKATKLLKNGSEIHLCGDSGNIHLIED